MTLINLLLQFAFADLYWRCADLLMTKPEPRPTVCRLPARRDPGGVLRF